MLEDERGQIVAIEVKSSETVGVEDFRHLVRMEALAGKKLLRSIVLYTGHQKLPFGHKKWALPISSLWN